MRWHKERVFTFDSGVRIEIRRLNFIPPDKKSWRATMTRPGDYARWNLSRGSTPRDAIKKLRVELAKDIAELLSGKQGKQWAIK